MKVLDKVLSRWRHRLTRRIAVGAVWAVALFGLAVPAWQQAVVNQQEIEQLEERLATMDQFERMHAGGLASRLSSLLRGGVYAQTASGNLGLFFATMLKKI